MAHIMKEVFFYSLCFCFFFCSVFQFNRVSSQTGTERAAVPPRGWNSYNSFSWIISEEEYLKNAEVVANRLKSKGYEYVVVDYLWYRRKVPGAYADSLGFDVIDEWGRMDPDPSRWPSSQGGKGFTEVAKKVHGMGLRFGIHVKRGISTQAVNANTPILDISKGSAYVESGRKWFASDIGDKSRTCGWMKNGFMSVNMDSGASKAFLGPFINNMLIGVLILFLKVASTKVSNSREKIVKWHCRDMVASVSPVLGLTKCSDSDAAGWVTESLNRGLQKICWKANPKHKYETPFCVYKRGPRLQCN